MIFEITVRPDNDAPEPAFAVNVTIIVGGWPPSGLGSSYSLYSGSSFSTTRWDFSSAI